MSEGGTAVVGPRKSSLTNDTESPLRSHSTFANIEKDGVDYNKVFAQNGQNSDGEMNNNGNGSSQKNGQPRVDNNTGDKNNDRISSTSPNRSKTGFNNTYPKSRFDNGSPSFRGSPSAGTSYYHGHIVDDNLHISDSKLDTTLLKMFSESPNSTGKSSVSNPGSKSVSPLGYSQSDFIGMEPVMWRVHPMTATHKETLERESDFIAFHVKPRDLISKLYRDGILTAMDYNQLTRTEPQGEKAVTRLLLKTLQRRGAKAYPALIDALLASNYPYVCERLTDTDQTLKHGILSDRPENEWMRDMHSTYSSPNGMGISANYGNNFSPINTHVASPSYPSNQYSPANHGNFYNGLPAMNQMNPMDQFPSNLYGSPTQNYMSPMGASSPDTRGLEKRLTDLSAGLRALQEDITALKSGRSLSPWHDQYTSQAAQRPNIPQSGQGLRMTPDGRIINVPYVEQQLGALEAKLAELLEYLSALKTADMQANQMPPQILTHPAVNPALANQQQQPIQTQTKPTSKPAAYPPQLEQHMKDLKDKIKELHDDVSELKKQKPQANQKTTPDYLSKNTPEYLPSMRPAASEVRNVDRDLLDSHLRDLRREINLLHDDVTALRRSRTPYSRADNRSYRSNDNYDSSRYDSRPYSRARRDSFDNYPSPTRRSRSPDLTRSKSDYNYSDPPSGLTPWTTRYPSRYSPVDGFKPRDSDIRRSPSRADSRSNTPRERKRSDYSRPSTRQDSRKPRDEPRGNRDDSKSRNRNDDYRPYSDRDDRQSKSDKDDYRRYPDDRKPYKDDKKPYSDRDDNRRYNDKDENRDNRKPYPDKDGGRSYNDDKKSYPGKDDKKTYPDKDDRRSIPKKEDYKTDPQRDYQPKKEEARPVHHKDNESNPDRYGPNYFDERDDDRPKKEDTVPKFKDDDKKSYPNGKDQPPSYPKKEDNRKSPPGKSDTTYPYKENDKQDGNTNPTPNNNQRPQPYQPTKTENQPSTSKQEDHSPNQSKGPQTVPKIITPDDHNDEAAPLYPQRRPWSPDYSRRANTLDTIEEVPDPTPKQKKRVSYSDLPPEQWLEPQGYRRAKTSPRPPSTDGSVTSDYERKWMTTPTRVLSPPTGVNYDRLTTPYKILRSPLKKRMTTWSKKSY